MFLGVALWTSYSPSRTSRLIWNARDVGPSAGYYGCLGHAFSTMDTALTTTTFIACLSILAIRLIHSIRQNFDDAHIVSADFAHLLALPLGFLAASTALDLNCLRLPLFDRSIELDPQEFEAIHNLR